MLIVKDGKTGKTFEIEPGSNKNGEEKPGIGYALFGFEFEFKITCTSPEEDPLFLRYYTMKMEQRIDLAGKDRGYIFLIETQPFADYSYERALAAKLREQGCEVEIKQPEREYEYHPDWLY